MNVVITGATKGIGRAIAEIFAKEGHNLFVCARTQADLEDFRTEILNSFPKLEVHIRAVDVSIKQEVIAFSEMIQATWSQVNVLVNNAGVWMEDYFLPPMSNADAHKERENVDILEHLMATNLYSAYYLTKHLLPTVMLPHKTGIVVNICSIASIKPLIGSVSYGISKFALLGFSKSLREELKPHNIKVTAILPGATWSNAWQGATFPKERLIQAKEIARTVLAVVQMGDSAVIEEVLIRPQLGGV